MTLNGVVAYLAFNLDKILLGRFYGAEALGVCGRAYQLTTLPTENLTETIGFVAFPALARIQNEPSRLKSYFLKGYGSFLSLLVPITVACALFSEDVVRVFLGAQWKDAVPIFRLLAPTILAFGLINPFAWLMLATGRAARSLKIGVIIAPVVILGYSWPPFRPARSGNGFLCRDGGFSGAAGSVGHARNLDNRARPPRHGYSPADLSGDWRSRYTPSARSARASATCVPQAGARDSALLKHLPGSVAICFQAEGGFYTIAARNASLAFL